MEARGILESLELANSPLALYDNYVKSKLSLKALSEAWQDRSGAGDGIHCHRYSQSYNVCMKPPIFSSPGPVRHSGQAGITKNIASSSLYGQYIKS
jgi:hypothetical protein